jgi:hypothetical protein
VYISMNEWRVYTVGKCVYKNVSRLHAELGVRLLCINIALLTCSCVIYLVAPCLSPETLSFSANSESANPLKAAVRLL